MEHLILFTFLQLAFTAQNIMPQMAPGGAVPPARFEKIADNVRCDSEKLSSGPSASGLSGCKEMCSSDERCEFFAYYSKRKYCETYITCDSRVQTHLRMLYKRINECMEEIKDSDARFYRLISKEFTDGMVRSHPPERNFHCYCISRNWMTCVIFVKEGSPEQEAVRNRLIRHDWKMLKPFFIAYATRPGQPPSPIMFEYEDSKSTTKVYAELDVLFPERCLPLSICSGTSGGICPVEGTPFVNGESVFIFSLDVAKAVAGQPVRCISVSGVRKLATGQRKDGDQTGDAMVHKDPWGREDLTKKPLVPGVDYIMHFIFDEDYMKQGICQNGNVDLTKEEVTEKEDKSSVEKKPAESSENGHDKKKKQKKKKKKGATSGGPTAMEEAEEDPEEPGPARSMSPDATSPFSGEVLDPAVNDSDPTTPTKRGSPPTKRPTMKPTASARQAQPESFVPVKRSKSKELPKRNKLTTTKPSLSPTASARPQRDTLSSAPVRRPRSQEAPRKDRPDATNVEATVIAIDYDKGYGFLDYEGEDVYFHISNVRGRQKTQMGTFSTLKEGDAVICDIEPSPDGKTDRRRAKNVRSIPKNNNDTNVEAVVLRINSDKGFGFLLYNHEEVFFNTNDIMGGHIRMLRDGDKVKCDIGPPAVTGGRRKATRIRIITVEPSSDARSAQSPPMDESSSPKSVRFSDAERTMPSASSPGSDATSMSDATSKSWPGVTSKKGSKKTRGQAASSQRQSNSQPSSWGSSAPRAQTISEHADPQPQSSYASSSNAGAASSSAPPPQSVAPASASQSGSASGASSSVPRPQSAGASSSGTQRESIPDVDSDEERPVDPNSENWNTVSGRKGRQKQPIEPEPPPKSHGKAPMTQDETLTAPGKLQQPKTAKERATLTIGGAPKEPSGPRSAAATAPQPGSPSGRSITPPGRQAPPQGSEPSRQQRSKSAQERERPPPRAEPPQRPRQPPASGGSWASVMQPRPEEHKPPAPSPQLPETGQSPKLKPEPPQRQLSPEELSVLRLGRSENSSPTNIPTIKPTQADDEPEELWNRPPTDDELSPPRKASPTIPETTQASSPVQPQPPPRVRPPSPEELWYRPPTPDDSPTPRAPTPIEAPSKMPVTYDEPRAPASFDIETVPGGPDREAPQRALTSNELSVILPALQSGASGQGTGSGTEFDGSRPGSSELDSATGPSEYESMDEMRQRRKQERKKRGIPKSFLPESPQPPDSSAESGTDFGRYSVPSRGSPGPSMSNFASPESAGSIPLTAQRTTVSLQSKPSTPLLDKPSAEKPPRKNYKPRELELPQDALRNQASNLPQRPPPAPRYQDKSVQTDSSGEEHVSAIRFVHVARGTFAMMKPSQRTLFVFIFFIFLIIFTLFYTFFTTDFDTSDNIYIEFNITDL